MHADRGAPDLMADLQAHGHDVEGFASTGDASWGSRDAGAVIVPELFNKLDLGTSAIQSLHEWVGDGGHLITCGDYFGHNGRFLNTVFGWDLQGVLSYGSASMGTACGIFCEGPRSLEWNPEVSCYAQQSLPPGVDVAYNESSSVCVFTLKVGEGRVTYLGFDWYNRTRHAWGRALQLAVVGSG